MTWCTNCHFPKDATVSSVLRHAIASALLNNILCLLCDLVGRVYGEQHLCHRRKRWAWPSRRYSDSAVLPSSFLSFLHLRVTHEVISVNFSNHTNCLRTGVANFLAKLDANSLLRHCIMRRSGNLTFTKLHITVYWTVLGFCSPVRIILKDFPKWSIPAFYNWIFKEKVICKDPILLGQSMYVIGLDDTVILDVVITNDDVDFVYIQCIILYNTLFNMWRILLCIKCDNNNIKFITFQI